MGESRYYVVGRSHRIEHGIRPGQEDRNRKRRATNNFETTKQMDDVNIPQGIFGKGSDSKD